MTLRELIVRAARETFEVREHIELAQDARDHAEERPFLELGLIDLGGEG